MCISNLNYVVLQCEFLYPFQDEILRQAVQLFKGKSWKRIGKNIVLFFSLTYYVLRTMGVYCSYFQQDLEFSQMSDRGIKLRGFILCLFSSFDFSVFLFLLSQIECLFLFCKDHLKNNASFTGREIPSLLWTILRSFPITILQNIK